MAVDDSRPVTAEVRKRTYIDHLCKLVNDALGFEVDASIKDRAVTCNGQRASIIIRMMSGEECTLSITDKDYHKGLLRQLSNQQRAIKELHEERDQLYEKQKELVQQLMEFDDDE